MPLPRASAPICSPRWRMRSRSQVAAALIPEGKTETRSAKRTPAGESCKQSPGKFKRVTAPVFCGYGSVMTFGVLKQSGIGD